MRNLFIRKNQDVSNITIVNISKTKQINELTKKINFIDQSIIQATKELLETQKVGIKAAFSMDNNWINKVQSEWYKKVIKKSASWQSNHIWQLHQKRRVIQKQLDILNGQFWPKKIRRYLIFLALSILGITGIYIIIMGIFAALYLLPIWGTFTLIYLYLLSNKRRV